MKKWQLEDLRDKRAKILLWLFMPLLSLVASIKSIGTKSSFVIIFLVSLQIGLCLTMGTERTEGTGDAVTYRADFEYASRNMSEAEFERDAYDYFVTNNTYDKDFYDNTLIYLVSRFTDNYHIFFLFAALLPAFFMLKYFKYYVLDENFKFTLLSIIPIIWFLLGQNNAAAGVRYYTASWVSLYAMYKIFLEKKYRYILLSIIASLIHVSLFSMFIVTVIGIFTRKYEYFWRIAFFVSIIYGSFSLIFLSDIGTYLPDFLQQMVQVYTSEEEVNKEVTGSGFYMIGNVFSVIGPYILMGIITLFMFKKDSIKENKNTKDLYLLLILVATYVNFFLAVPSMGTRVMMRTELPLICYIWMSNSKVLKQYRWMLWVYMFFMLFSIKHQFEQYLSYMQLDFYIASPVLLFIKYAILP